MTHSRIEDPAEVRYNTVGHEFEFTEVRVIDPETGEECPVGVQGEMCNRGYNNMKGYYKTKPPPMRRSTRMVSCIPATWAFVMRMETSVSPAVSRI